MGLPLNCQASAAQAAAHDNTQMSSNSPLQLALNCVTTDFHNPRAGQKHTAPHLRIKELMDAPEKSAVWPQNRRELRVVVLLRLGCAPVYGISSGSSYDGMQKLPIYKKSDGEEYKALSAVEYVDLVSASLGKLDVTREGHRLSPAEHLLHDKCTAHTAKVAKDELSKRIHVMQLATDSPDLTPCDTSFFAAVKGRWQRELARQPRPWAESCQLALEIISTTNPDKYIMALPLRWQACINAEGWHIEQEYKLLKAAEKAG
jgi:hypothetical protein